MRRRKFSICYLVVDGETAFTITQDMRRKRNVVTGRSSLIWVGPMHWHHRELAKSFGAAYVIRVTHR